MINNAVEEYFQTLKNQSPISVDRKDDNEKQHQTQTEHSELNKGFARLLLEESPNIIRVNLPEIGLPPAEGFATAEKELKKEELASPGQIDMNKVDEYLKLEPSNKIDIDVPLFQAIEKLAPMPNETVEIPNNFWGRTKDTKVVEIGIQNLTVGGASFPGFFQLYNQIDGNNMLPITEPLFFENNHFTQTTTPVGLDKAYFFCAEPKPTIYLICFLYRKFGNNPTYLPFAVAGKQLFCDDGNGNIHPREDLNKIEKEKFVNLVNQTDIKGKINMVLNISALSNPDLIVKNDVEALLQVNIYPWNQYSFTHTWIGNAGPQNKLEAVSIDPPFSCPTPIVSIFDLEFFFKNPPKDQLSYFKAYVINEPIKNLNSVQGLPLFITSKPTKESEITSLIVQSAGQISFCENIRIFINKQLTNNNLTGNNQTYLAIFFYSSALEKKEPTLYKIGYIPLFNITNNIEKGPQKFTLYDPKRLPKDLKHPKPPNRTYVQCRVSLPSVYFPFPSCHKFINTTDMNNLELPEGDSESLLSVIIPIFSKMLPLISAPNLKKCIEYLSQFDKNKLKDIFRSWAYSVYNPNVYPNSTYQLLTNINALFEELSRPAPKDDAASQKSKAQGVNLPIRILSQGQPAAPRSNDLVKQLTAQLPIYVDIFISSIYKYDRPVDDYKPFMPFFSSFSKFLTVAYKECSDEDLISAVDSVSTFLFHLMYKCPFKEISEYIFQILNAIHSLRTPQQLAKSSIITFHFLSRFASTPQFIVGIGSLTKRVPLKRSFSPYNKLLSIFFLAIFECLTVDNKEAILMCCRFLKMIAFHIEQLPDDVVTHITYSIFPILHCVLSDYDSKPIKETPGAQNSLIPFILIVLNKAEPEVINSFFLGLSGSIQYISKLGSLLETVWRSGLEKHLQFFIEITKRLLQFLHIILDPKMNKKFVALIIEMCRILLDEQQSPTTFNYFYHFIRRVIEMFKCERKLITLLLKKIQSKYLSKRCLATALLSHQFWCDYTRNKSIVLSSIDTMDSLTSILLKLKAEDIDIYNQFIQAMDHLSLTKENDDFKNAVHERMAAAQIIINVVKDQKISTYPVEDRCQQIMMIADQYKMFPTMRMKWLQECLKTNRENDDNISAFVAQLHVVTLIATVYYHNNYEKNPGVDESNSSAQVSKLPFHLSVVQPIRYAMKMDDNIQDSFKFIPEVAEETKIDFASMNPVALELLNDMSLDVLITELKKAVEIGLEAGLYYSLRPIHSFALRLRHRTRNFKECANSCTELSEIFNKITTKTINFTHDTPIAAYLVIDKQNGQIKQSVYYINVSVSVSSNKNVNLGDQKIIEILKKDQRRGEKVNLCPRHHSIDCKYPGTCVVPLEIDQDIIQNDEHPHNWSHFKTRIYYSDYENTDFKKPINVIHVTTKDAIPHYRMCVDVDEANTNIVSCTMTEIFDESMNKTLDVCNKISEDLEMWFINQQNTNYGLTNEQLYSGEVERIITILDEIVKTKKDNFNDRLRKLKGKDIKKSNEVALKAREALERIMKVFSRITNDLPNNIPHFSMFSQLIGGFCQEFNLEPIKTDSLTFESYQDPMTQTFDFES